MKYAEAYVLKLKAYSIYYASCKDPFLQGASLGALISQLNH